MPVIRVSWWAGQTSERKDQLALAITEAATKLGIPAEATHVVFEDVPKEDWYIGGVSASRRQHPPQGR